MKNPFSRKRRDPLDQLVAALDSVRSEAAKQAATVRDAASEAVDFLGEAAPESTRRRLPVIGGVLALAVAVALALRARRGSGRGATTAEQPLASPAATAAKAAAAPKPAPKQEIVKPASEVEPEQPKEPTATTNESESASGNSKP